MSKEDETRETRGTGLEWTEICIGRKHGLRPVHIDKTGMRYVRFKGRRIFLDKR